MILKIFIVIALLVAGVIIAAAFKPNTFRIQRSIGIQALPEKILPLLDDLHNWSRWGATGSRGSHDAENVQQSRKRPWRRIGMEQYREGCQRTNVDNRIRASSESSGRRGLHKTVSGSQP